MVNFTENKLELSAGKVVIKNETTVEKAITIYVPNKDSVPCNVPAGCTVEITTVSAGETFMYLSQAQEGLTIGMATAVAGNTESTEGTKPSTGEQGSTGEEVTG